MNAQRTLAMLMPAVLTMKDPLNVDAIMAFLEMD